MQRQKIVQKVSKTKFNILQLLRLPLRGKCGYKTPSGLMWVQNALLLIFYAEGGILEAQVPFTICQPIFFLASCSKGSFRLFCSFIFFCAIVICVFLHARLYMQFCGSDFFRRFKLATVDFNHLAP